MKNWKTTASGVALALALLFNSASAALDNDPNTTPDITAVMGAISALALAFHSKDAE